jgi:hypothetical protein
LIIAKNANARRNTAGAVLDDVVAAGNLNATNLIFGHSPSSKSATKPIQQPPQQQSQIQQQHRIWRPLIETTSVPPKTGGDVMKTPVSGRKSTPRSFFDSQELGQSGASKQQTIRQKEESKINGKNESNSSDSLERHQSDSYCHILPTTTIL